VGRAIGTFVTKVCKYNKRGIDVHFLNQEPQVGTILKVSEALPIRADVYPTIAPDKVKKQETVRRGNTVFWATDRGSVARSLRSVRTGVL